MELIKSIYQNVLPQNLQTKIRLLRDRNTDFGLLRKEILTYYDNLPPEQVSTEIAGLVEFIRKEGIATFPYPFIDNYDYKNVKVHQDTTLDLPFVIHDGKRLYFKKTWSEELIKKNYNFLAIEQDIASPHRYLTPEFDVKPNDLIVDVGAAEGNFSLSVVDKAKHIYIFETDEEWLEALQATFNPWKEKVTIINRYVSDISDDNNVDLDSYFRNKGHVNFIKIDAEGAEKKILQGMKNIMQNSLNLKIALCTYHQQNDAQEFTDKLKNLKFNCSLSAGYMLFLEDKLAPPYFRKGLLRAHKSGN